MTIRATAEDFFPDWAAIAAVVLGITTFAVAEGLAHPLVSLVLESRKVPESLIGLSAGAFAAGLATATFLIRPLTERINGDRLIVLGLVGCAACLATFALTTSIWVWFGTRFVHGFFASLIFILSEAWLNAACPDRIRGRVSGLYGAGLCAGFAAGPLAIPLFGSESGFAFAIAAVYVAIVAFLTAVLSRRTRTRPEPAPAGGIVRFVRTAPLLAAMVLAFGFADIAGIAIMPVYFVQTGHSEAFAALSVTVMALPTALAQPLVGMLLDRVSRPVVAIAAAGTAAAGFLMLPWLPTETAILAVFGLMGAAIFALYTSALTMLGESRAGGLLVSGSAAFSLAYALGSAGGSVTTGTAMDLLTPAAGPLSAGVFLAAFAALFAVGGVLRRRRGQSGA